MSRVKAGENAGSTLEHDHVVNFYQPVEAWDATLPVPAVVLSCRPDPGPRDGR